MVSSASFAICTRFTLINPDEDSPPNQDSLSEPDALAGQVAQLIRLLRTGEEANTKLALLLAKGLGYPPAFEQYLTSLLPLYQLAFKSKRKKLDVLSLTKLFQPTELNVLERELHLLPDNIGELLNLQAFNCTGNQLKTLPESIGQLLNLQELYCSENQLQSLPESLGKLQNLQRLDCSFNRLPALPESLGALQELDWLYCSFNQLQSLPESLGVLHNLEALDCRNNQLKVLPESLAGLSLLKRVDARGNPLTHIPQALWEKEGLELLVD